MLLTTDKIRALPKVLLHDHIDGGLRPATIVELARESAVSLPTEDPAELAAWFHRGATRGSLPLYLEGFAATIAVMQTKEALERIAFELVEDLAADGVVYAEERFAPVFHTSRGLTLEEVMAATIAGLARGERDFGVPVRLIVCAMRNMSDSLEMAELAVDFRDRGAVGFDIAGDECGHPPKRHIEAFHYVQRNNFNITIHAGEAFGKESIWQALQFCGAHRIGHATRLVDDLVIEDGRVVALGELARYVLDKRIPLELCLSCNVHTGAAESIENHPFKHLYRHKFRVTLNTDNRLMSQTSMTQEFDRAVAAFGLGVADVEKITINTMKSAFVHYEERCRLIYDIIKPGYRRFREREGVA